MPFRSASQLLQLLARRDITASELLEAYLNRIEKYNPQYNIVVALCADEARKAAAAVDSARERGEPLGPLAGLPMTIKDAFEVVGMPATCGLRALAAHRPQRDADAVRRLRAAGAILFGKTNLPAGATDHQSFNSVYGLTSNPWNPERTVGGSSGGAAAALAAGFTVLELGSDIGGSIRVPAHFCGVFGHKPSFGLVPTRGHIPPAPGVLNELPLNVVGPMARSASDLRLALDVLAGPRDLSAKGWKLQLPASRYNTLRDFRVALWTGGGVYPVDSAYREAIKLFAEDLRRLGTEVDEKPTLPFEPEQAYDFYMNMLFAIIAADMPSKAREALAAYATAATDPRDYAVRLQRYVNCTLKEWQTLQERQEQQFLAFGEFFKRYDVLICPCHQTAAFPHDTSGEGIGAQLTRTVTVSGAPSAYLNNLMWPSIATFAHLPATAMPTGRYVDGLPAGVQIIGAFLEDRTTLRFAELVENELAGFAPPPALATARN
jgi:amidase